MDHNYIKGICTQMCPEDEIIFRETKSLLHILEIKPGTEANPQADRNRIVKEYSRSAAGQSIQSKKKLRTVGALLSTIHYLLHDVIIMDHVDWKIIYDFIMDRLRAVRQDMVIQNFQKTDCISILQPIIKFYTYAAYRMCEEQIANYDPVLNQTHLQECLKRLLYLYDDTDRLLCKFDKGDNFDEIKKNLMYVDTRPFMESLYLIVNMGSTEAIDRALKLPKMWKTPVLKQCLKLSLEYWKKNYVRVCRMISKLPYLLCAYAVLHLPSIRRDCLKIMSTAFSSPNLVFPSDVLTNILLFDDKKDLYNYLNYYGIPIKEGNIAFHKTHFNNSKPLLKPKHLKYVDDMLNSVTIPELLLYID